MMTSPSKLIRLASKVYYFSKTLNKVYLVIKVVELVQPIIWSSYHTTSGQWLLIAPGRLTHMHTNFTDKRNFKKPSVHMVQQERV